MLMESTIVLIHGLVGHLNDPRIHAAFGEHRVVSPDLLGYGSFARTTTAGLTLDQQADHILRYLNENHLNPAHLVGHSVGGAVAVLAAHANPDAVATLTSVEGNFTPEDAFWSASIAAMSDREVARLFEGYRAEPAKWLEEAGLPLSDWTCSLAVSWLENQPPGTIKAQARAVVESTSKSDYLQAVDDLLDSDIPVSLVAGAQSASGWNVPAWVRRRVSNDIVVGGASHLLMAEDPGAFADAVLECCVGAREPNSTDQAKGRNRGISPKH